MSALPSASALSLDYKTPFQSRNMTPSRILQTSIAVVLASPALFAQTPAQRLQRPLSEERAVPTLSAVVVTSERSERTDYNAETATTASRGIAAPILDTPRSVQVVTP